MHNGKMIAIAGGISALVVSMAAYGAPSAFGAVHTPMSNPKSHTHTINLGAGPIKVGSGKLNIAFFSDGSTNPYLIAANAAAEHVAKQAHVGLTYFDGDFTATTETSQMEQALSTGKYNGWAVESSAPDACRLITEAIKKSILVSTFNDPQCHPSTTQGAKAWIRGTLNYVAGTQSSTVFHKWLTKIVSLNPGPQHVFIETGPADLAQSHILIGMFPAVEKKDPTFKITTLPVTAYTTAGADTIAAGYLTGHPTTTIVAGEASTLTLGEIDAIKAAGQLRKIKVYDAGGTKKIAEDVKAGIVQFTTADLPATESADSVLSIISAWGGKVGPHYVTVMESRRGKPFFITKSNVGSYVPQW
ncbi:MAG: substrate-binding domain-containing protein [Acidimicrobiales bacterium]